MAKSGNKLSTPARKSGAKTNAASKPKKAAATRSHAGVTTASGDGDGRAKKGVVARAASRVGKAIKSVTSKIRPAAAKAKKREEAAIAAQTPHGAKRSGKGKAARVARRESDIPMDRIAETYTPPQTSLKGGMRGNGAGRQNDQEHGRGVDDDRWNDEDIITNKSGDPRIGTHGRTYEPGEARAASRNRE